MAVISKNHLVKNLAHITTLVRVILIFCAIALLFHNGSPYCILGSMILFLALLLDGVDGILARKFNANSKVGALIDTLGDRITENTFLVFLAYKQLIPLFVPIIFISRSFLSDFVRSLALQRGIGTFALNTSLLGRCLVASKTSRAIYLILKFMVFFIGAFMITWPDMKICEVALPLAIFYGAMIITAMNLVRFAVLLWDSRKILEETFCAD
jgi:CDP-diacylglycerol--glycerol-3-phosphate 3-phosphatidyltransferase